MTHGSIFAFIPTISILVPDASDIPMSFLWSCGRCSTPTTTEAGVLGTSSFKVWRFCSRFFGSKKLQVEPILLPGPPKAR